MKRITLEKVIRSLGGESYQEQYDKVMDLIHQGKLRPVKASGTNGKKPVLYLEYWTDGEKKDYSGLEEELKYRMTPAVSVDYYLNHLRIYEEDREAVLCLNDYLKNHRDLLLYSESVNERSFEIWGREKFLTKGPGRKILSRCGIREETLNMYGTAEPFAYYSHTRAVPQAVLILENKDTFYSMRRFLMEGADAMFGIRIGTLIYGGGKRVLRSFSDFELCAEPYMKQKENQFFYFGDLDYEGIRIFESLAGEFPGVRPFIPAYVAMLEKAERLENADDVQQSDNTGQCLARLPETKEKQNRNLNGSFFSFFGEETAFRMKAVLEKDKYIPQEILNIHDF